MSALFLVGSCTPPEGVSRKILVTTFMMLPIDPIYEEVSSM